MAFTWKSRNKETVNKSMAKRMAPSTPDPDMCALWEDEWQPYDQATGVEAAMGGSVQLRLRDGGRHH